MHLLFKLPGSMYGKTVIWKGYSGQISQKVYIILGNELKLVLISHEEVMDQIRGLPAEHDEVLVVDRLPPTKKKRAASSKEVPETYIPARNAPPMPGPGLSLDPDLTEVSNYWSDALGLQSMAQSKAVDQILQEIDRTAVPVSKWQHIFFYF
jgi:hypothetical protein